MVSPSRNTLPPQTVRLQLSQPVAPMLYPMSIRPYPAHPIPSMGFPTKKVYSARAMIEGHLQHPPSPIIVDAQLQRPKVHEVIRLAQRRKSMNETTLVTGPIIFESFCTSDVPSRTRAISWPICDINKRKERSTLISHSKRRSNRVVAAAAFDSLKPSTAPEIVGVSRCGVCMRLAAVTRLKPRKSSPRIVVFLLDR